MPRKIATVQGPKKTLSANHPDDDGQPTGAIPPAAIPAESWVQFLLRPLRFCCWDHPEIAVTLLVGLSAFALTYVTTNASSNSHTITSPTPTLSKADLAYLQNNIPGWKPSDGLFWAYTQGSFRFDLEETKRQFQEKTRKLKAQ